MVDSESIGNFKSLAADSTIIGKKLGEFSCPLNPLGVCHGESVSSKINSKGILSSILVKWFREFLVINPLNPIYNPLDTAYLASEVDD